MSTVIFCAAYGTFLVFFSIDVIFVCTWEFLSFCYGATNLVFFLLKECCPHLISNFIPINLSFRLVLFIFIPFFIGWGFVLIKLFSFLLTFGFSFAHLHIIAIFSFHI